MQEQNDEISVNKKQLSEISRLSALLIPPDDIAVFLDLDAKKFAYEISVKTTEISRAFRRGYLKTLIGMRTSLMEEINMMDDEEVEITVPEQKLLEISRLIEDYEAIIQSNINNA